MSCVNAGQYKKRTDNSMSITAFALAWFSHCFTQNALFGSADIITLILSVRINDYLFGPIRSLAATLRRQETRTQSNIWYMHWRSTYVYCAYVDGAPTWWSLCIFKKWEFWQNTKFKVGRRSRSYRQWKNWIWCVTTGDLLICIAAAVLLAFRCDHLRLKPMADTFMPLSCTSPNEGKLALPAAVPLRLFISA